MIGAVRRTARATLLALCAVVLGLGACSSDKPKPAALDNLAPKIAGRQVWSARVDRVDFPLGVTVREGQFIVAAGDGTVLALDAQTGREVWRGQAGERLAAGVGSDGRFAAVVTRGNELVVLDRGERKWTQRLPSRTVTPPLVAGERVFAMGVNRSVRAYDALDGRLLWVFDRPGEALTLSQPGLLAAYRDTLVVGQGPLMVGLDPLRGTVRWEGSVANPRGTNEVERLADLVGPAVRVADTLCARSFQAAVGCIQAENGANRWSRNVGGIQAVAGDASALFGGDASDRVRAWNTANGDLLWMHERLLHRGLSAPALAGSILIFGDFEGQVHFMARASGEALLRLPTDGSAVVAPPVVAGTTVLVVTRNGGLFAFRPE